MFFQLLSGAASLPRNVQSCQPDHPAGDSCLLFSLLSEKSQELFVQLEPKGVIALDFYFADPGQIARLGAFERIR